MRTGFQPKQVSVLVLALTCVVGPGPLLLADGARAAGDPSGAPSVLLHGVRKELHDHAAIVIDRCSKESLPRGWGISLPMPYEEPCTPQARMTLRIATIADGGTLEAVLSRGVDGIDHGVLRIRERDESCDATVSGRATTDKTILRGECSDGTVVVLTGRRESFGTNFDEELGEPMRECLGGSGWDPRESALALSSFGEGTPGKGSGERARSEQREKEPRPTKATWVVARSGDLNVTWSLLDDLWAVMQLPRSVLEKPLEAHVPVCLALWTGTELRVERRLDMVRVWRSGKELNIHRVDAQVELRAVPDPLVDGGFWNRIVVGVD